MCMLMSKIVLWQIFGPNISDSFRHLQRQYEMKGIRPRHGGHPSCSLPLLWGEEEAVPSGPGAKGVAVAPWKRREAGSVGGVPINSFIPFKLHPIYPHPKVEPLCTPRPCCFGDCGHSPNVLRIPCSLKYASAPSSSVVWWVSSTRFIHLAISG